MGSYRPVTDTTSSLNRCVLSNDRYVWCNSSTCTCI